MDAAGHDADFGFAGRDDAGAVGADEARGRVLELGPDLHHVECGNALSDADDEGDAGVFGFEDGVGGKRRRDEDHGGVGAGLLDRVGHGVEHRPAFVRRSTLAGRDAADNVGAVFGAALGVEGAFFAGESLNDQARIFIYQNRHFMLPTFAAAATTISAASFIVAPTWKFRPTPCKDLAAFFNIRAFEAQHDRHLDIEVARGGDYAGGKAVNAQDAAEDIDEDCFYVGVESRISKACSICSCVAPPPTSRKFAGLPPAY